MRTAKCERCSMVWNVSVHLHIPGVYICPACEELQNRILERMKRKAAQDETYKTKHIARDYG